MPLKIRSPSKQAANGLIWGSVKPINLKGLQPNNFGKHLVKLPAPWWSGSAVPRSLPVAWSCPSQGSLREPKCVGWRQLGQRASWNFPHPSCCFAQKISGGTLSHQEVVFGQFSGRQSSFHTLAYCSAVSNKWDLHPPACSSQWHCWWFGLSCIRGLSGLS